MDYKNFFDLENDWKINIKKLKKDQLVHYGSNLLAGNGYLAYRGSLEEWGQDQYQACIVSDTYDCADGKWKELSNAPNALFTEVKINDQLQADFLDNDLMKSELSFDYRYGIFKRHTKAQDSNLEIISERFASYDNLHLIANKYQLKNISGDKIELKLGIDGNLWDLNGPHLENFKGEYDSRRNLLYLKAETTASKIDLVTVLAFDFKKGKIKKSRLEREAKSIYLILTIEAADAVVSFERQMIVYSSSDVSEPLLKALSTAEKTVKESYQSLKRKHQKIWDQKWELMDIKIKGNQLDQLAVHFNLYHNIIAVPAHSERLPIGARGLSSQAYQGSAFWDQEIFNLPMFIYTEPETARNILKYRYHTLNGARKKAEDLGYAGAFYAWISGKSGRELCPSFFFKDLISGRKIRNHFNDWQIHVSPDISYTIWKYYQITNDLEFILNYGSEILFEVARFLHSRVHYNQYQDRYEIIRLLGPDEYHENVDNNAFTNYQSQFALKKALYFYFKMENEYPEKLAELKNKIDLKESEITAWQEITEKLYLPQPAENKLIEQFDGYFDLEDSRPALLKDRLIEEDEYWGWPNGVAVFTQVIKQADLIQLFALHDIFSTDILAANYDYYEPRTEHGSSLSPSQYGITAAGIGRRKEAYDYFKRSAFIDLMNTNKAVSGGTFIGGIHTAAAGGLWQLIINGFAGLKIKNGQLSFKPLLPDSWQEIEFKLIYRKNKLKFSLSSSYFEAASFKENKKPVDFRVNDKHYKLKVGEKIKIKLKSD